jgi:hypothetical protein
LLKKNIVIARLSERQNKAIQIVFNQNSHSHSLKEKQNDKQTNKVFKYFTSTMSKTTFLNRDSLQKKPFMRMTELNMLNNIDTLLNIFILVGPIWLSLIFFFSMYWLALLASFQYMAGFESTAS